jgi:SAM-dependent methyltransferase
MASTGNWWDSEVETVPAPAPTFGFAWAQGYVAPFSPADLDASRVALEMAAGVAGRPLTSLTFTDFGCGDGAVVLLAASLGMPTCTGIDLDESLLASATAAAAALPGGCPPGVSFTRADVQTYPTQGTDVLFWHMLPDALPRSPALGDRLLDALDGGMVMVTIRWKVPLGEWEPYLRAQAGTGEKQLFFVYGSPPAATLPPSAPLPALGAGAGTPAPSLPSWDVLDGQAKEAFQVCEGGSVCVLRPFPSALRRPTSLAIPLACCAEGTLRRGK